MKTKLLLATLVLAAASPLAAADRVDPSQLPPAVKKTLDASGRAEPVKQITVRHVNGRAVYDVEFERKLAPNSHLRIAEDGQVLTDTTVGGVAEPPAVYSEYGPATPVLPRLRLEELPRAAQDTIRRDAAGRDVTAITADTIDGHKAYAVEFGERGRNPLLYVGEDGVVLRPAEKPPLLGVGTTFSDTPAAVQQTLRREARDGEIVKIDKEGRRTEPNRYRVEIKDARGTYQLRISEDGRVLENTRATTIPPGRG